MDRDLHLGDRIFYLAEQHSIIRFGAYQIDLISGELRKHGLLLRLQEQSFRVLNALLQHPGELVTREDLIKTLWSDGTVVDFDHGLNAAVTRLRQVLMDSADSPKFVETVPGKGYRFIASIENGVSIPKPTDITVGHERSGGSPQILIGRIKKGLLAMLLLSAIPLAWWKLRDVPKQVSWDNVVPLTTEIGSERNVSFSPDASQIAYEWENGGAPHVYMRQVSMGDPIRLTDAIAAERSPAWSRDGRFIAFLRRVSDTKFALIVVPVLGKGVEKTITELPTPDRGMLDATFRYLDWTKDGKYLIVACPEHQGGPISLLAVSIETLEKHWITHSLKTEVGDFDPAVSPDGLTLAFTRRTALYKFDIFLLSLAKGFQRAGEPNQLTFQRGLNPAWTQDGSEIVFVSGRGNHSSLWRIAAKSPVRPRLIASFGQPLSLPSIGAGNKLAFVRSISDSNIWRQEIIARTGPFTQPTRLIASTLLDRNAEYSPDGNKIALQSSRAGGYAIWVCSSDGEHCTQLTAVDGLSGTPRWSPDGNQIAFDSDRAGAFDIYIIGANGGPIRRLTNDPGDDEIPSWSRDGRWIYFMSARTGQREIWKIPAKGGSEIQVTRNGGSMAIESIDGNYLYHSDSTNTKLLRCLLDGSGETEVVDWISGRSFAMTANQILYLRPERNGDSSLRTMSLANGDDKNLVTIRKPVDSGLSVSPDGRNVIYTQVDMLGSDLWMLDGLHWK